MKTSSRVASAAAAMSMVAASVLLGPASPAHAVVDPSATVSDVSCVDQDGTVTVTLEAGDSAQTFMVLVDGSTVGDATDTPVDAGATATVVATGLADGDHTVEVLLEHDSADPDTIASEDRTVACDVAPEGPYTNIMGDVFDECEGNGEVLASNAPIAGATDNLQPVTFEVVFTSTDDTTVDPATGGDGGDPTGGVDPPPTPAARSAVGTETVLDTFVLDANTQTYDRMFGPDELGGTGDLTLRAGDQVVATAHIGLCIVSPVAAGGVESSSSSGNAVPDTGY